MALKQLRGWKRTLTENGITGQESPTVFLAGASCDEKTEQRARKEALLYPSIIYPLPVMQFSLRDLQQEV